MHLLPNVQFRQHLSHFVSLKLLQNLIANADARPDYLTSEQVQALRGAFVQKLGVLSMNPLTRLRRDAAVVQRSTQCAKRLARSLRGDLSAGREGRLWGVGDICRESESQTKQQTQVKSAIKRGSVRRGPGRRQAAPTIVQTGAFLKHAKRDPLFISNHCPCLACTLCEHNPTSTPTPHSLTTRTRPPRAHCGSAESKT